MTAQSASTDSLVEHTLSREIPWQGAFLQVWRDTVRLPDGRSSAREYVHHPGAVVILAVRDDGALVMERQYRHPLGQVFWEFPAGKLDANEPPLVCAQRELKEETGFEAQQWEHLGVIHPCIGYSDEKIEVFLARGLRAGERALDEHEFLEVFAMSPAEIEAAMASGQMTDAKTLAAFCMARSRLTAGA